jgi:hypothetical protein
VTVGPYDYGVSDEERAAIDAALAARST